MPLTDMEIRAAKPSEKAYRMYDEHGLYLDVRPSGNKIWRFKYRFSGKENTLTLGSYPIISVKDARIKRDEARRMIYEDADPAFRRKEVIAKASLPTFGDIALEFTEKIKRESRSEKYRYAFEMRVHKFILPAIGRLTPDEISAPAILTMLRGIEAAGTLETAHRVRAMTGQIFRYAIVTGRAERDPSADLRGALQSVPERHFGFISDTKKLGALLRGIDGYLGSAAVRNALKLQAYTFVRPGELRYAEWPELALEGETKEWHIPAEKMKMKRPHIVPLSLQAAALFDEMKNISGRGRYVFPSARSVSGARPMSDNAMVAALRSMGYTGEEMTAHGFRHTASTLLNDSRLWSADAIERQLAHADENKVRRIYNAAEYLPERRQMMQWWADYLDTLRLVLAEGQGQSAP